MAEEEHVSSAATAASESLVTLGNWVHHRYMVCQNIGTAAEERAANQGTNERLKTGTPVESELWSRP